MKHLPKFVIAAMFIVAAVVIAQKFNATNVRGSLISSSSSTPSTTSSSSTSSSSSWTSSFSSTSSEFSSSQSSSFTSSSSESSATSSSEANTSSSMSSSEECVDPNAPEGVPSTTFAAAKTPAETPPNFNICPNYYCCEKSDGGKMCIGVGIGCPKGTAQVGGVMSGNDCKKNCLGKTCPTVTCKSPEPDKYPVDVTSNSFPNSSLAIANAKVLAKKACGKIKPKSKTCEAECQIGGTPSYNVPELPIPHNYGTKTKPQWKARLIGTCIIQQSCVPIPCK